MIAAAEGQPIGSLWIAATLAARLDVVRGGRERSAVGAYAVG